MLTAQAEAGFGLREQPSKVGFKPGNEACVPSSLCLGSTLSGFGSTADGLVKPGSPMVGMTVNSLLNS